MPGSWLCTTMSCSIDFVMSTMGPIAQGTLSNICLPLRGLNPPRAIVHPSLTNQHQAFSSTPAGCARQTQVSAPMFVNASCLTIYQQSVRIWAAGICLASMCVTNHFSFLSAVKFFCFMWSNVTVWKLMQSS